MLNAFIGAVKDTLANATLIHDHFHLIQVLNTAINRVRRREATSHPELKDRRYALLRNEANRTKKQFFKVVQESNLEFSLA